MKAFLDRHSALVGWLSGLGIPLALVAAGWLITNSIEKSKLESEYVRIALGILSKEQPPTAKDAEPQKPNDDEMALRRWAVRLLNRTSPEKFNDEEQHALLHAQKSPFAGIVSATYDHLNRLRSMTDRFGNTTTFEYDDVGNLTTRKLTPSTPTPEPK